MLVAVSEEDDMADYPVLKLKKGRDVSLRRGHPWIFSGAVSRVEGHPASGDVVAAASCDGDPLALGFYQPSDIVFRRLSWDTRETVDIDFWRRRLRDAVSLRRRILPPDTTAYRLVNAEGDGMPGLVADLYDDVLAVSIGTSGMDRRREELVEVFRTELCPGRIYERSEGRSRRREGLSDRVGLLLGERLPALVPIREEGRKYLVDVASGQKTGFFLDQRDNRARVERLARGRRTLNVFAYTGGFSLYAARGGAPAITSVDLSAPALADAARNFALNAADPAVAACSHTTVVADAFETLAGLRRQGKSFDLVIVDPPAFAKRESEIASALQAYARLTELALGITARGGRVVLASCSSRVAADQFFATVNRVALDMGRPLRELERTGHAIDHPIRFREGAYLKCLFAEAP